MQYLVFAMQKYVGIIDILIVLFILLLAFIGYKIGFFNTALKIGSVISGFVFSIALCKPFSKFLGLFFYKPLFNRYNRKVRSLEVFQKITGAENPNDALKEVLVDLNFPNKLASFIAKRVNVSDVENLQNSIANGISKVMANTILVVISFIVLLIGTAIVLFIMRKFIETLRENNKFRVFDGILGIVFWLLIAFVIITIIFFILTFFSKSGGVYEFLNRDLRIESRKGIGLGRWFYSSNILRILFNLIF